MRSRTRKAVTALKARHLRRSSASFSLRSSIRVPTFRAWKKCPIRRRSPYQRSTARAFSKPGLPWPVSRSRSRASPFLLAAGGGFSSLAETASMRSGIPPASFGGIRSTSKQRSVRRTLCPARRAGPPQAGVSIVRMPTGSACLTCSCRPRTSPFPTMTRRRTDLCARARSRLLYPGRTEDTGSRLPGRRRRRPGFQGRPPQAPSPGRALPTSGRCPFPRPGGSRRPAGTSPIGRPATLTAVPAWARIPFAPLPPPPRLSRPSAAARPS